MVADTRAGVPAPHRQCVSKRSGEDVRLSTGEQRLRITWSWH
jgi:hypothetical protein